MALGLGLALATALVGCDDRRRGSGAPATSASLPEDTQQVAIEATATGFEPAEVHVRQGRPAVLTFTRVVASSCVDAVKMPWREEPYELPLDKPIQIVIPDTSKAGTFTYSCWMDMVHGRVFIDPAPAATKPP